MTFSLHCYNINMLYLLYHVIINMLHLLYHVCKAYRIFWVITCTGTKKTALPAPTDNLHQA